ncbi:MAG: NAD(P)(+) transhydrogenase (Re/Si-specific) subunit beta [Fermentimonas sp.]|nr:NAD(P)(+) transhydrogenase (Re/Si-specific) subunit beta [Fermentimonas sp.]
MSETLYYIICVLLSVAVLAGISLMSKVKTAVAGNLISAFSVLLGVIITLLYKELFSAWTIYIFILIGILIGATLALRVKMIQMPQLVALLNGVGGLASALVGVLSLLGVGAGVNEYPVFANVTSVLAIEVGLVTLFGSLVAAGKLHKLLSQKPVVWKNHSAVLNGLMFIIVGVVIFTLFFNDNSVSTYLVLILSIVASSLFGYAFAIRVGGADMPITISLLNSLSGVAGAIAGMAVNDLMLVSVGGIVGASGLFLTQIMCKAMNRSLKDILLGKTSVDKNSPKADKSVMVETPEEEVHGNEDNILIIKRDEGDIIRSAKSVIIVPGYGMALAQAQHLVRTLADKFEENGAEVKFAIHPVAGRMPGHMNVLLAEADVPYEKLFEMDAVNDEFAETDVVIVIGANDVINPAARNAKDTPIYGMPVLNVDQAKEIFICNFDLQPGYAGVDNPLYKKEEGVHLLLGDAKESISNLIDRFD